MRDLANNITLTTVEPPVAAVTDNTPFVGAIIDNRGYDSLTYCIQTGSIADVDATFTVLLEEGDDSGLSDAASVANADMVVVTDGEAPEISAAPLFSDDNSTKKLGYLGNKRYTRITITPAANTGDIFLSITAIQGHPALAETAA